MLCNHCGQKKSQYSVVRPPCAGTGSARVCPDCFQHGINKGNIVWFGSKAFGVCEDHLSVAAS